MASVDATDQVVELLWHARDERASSGLRLAHIVLAGIEVADADGLAGLSMRKVAERVGFTTMSLYRHVPSRDHLVDLMRDAVSAQVAGPARSSRTQGWRARLGTCARQLWELRRQHPWLAEIRGTRHLPGPNVVARYEHMLSILAATSLRPADVVAAAELVGRFVDAEALALVERARTEHASGQSDEQWWRARDALFARLDRYPTLTRLWQGGGFDQRADPFEFGLARVLDGIELLIDESDGLNATLGESNRDEMSDELAWRGQPCRVCGIQIRQLSSGRPRTYCSHACRQRAYRARRAG